MEVEDEVLQSAGVQSGARDASEVEACAARGEARLQPGALAFRHEQLVGVLADAPGPKAADALEEVATEGGQADDLRRERLGQEFPRVGTVDREQIVRSVQ